MPQIITKYRPPTFPKQRQVLNRQTFLRYAERTPDLFVLTATLLHHFPAAVQMPIYVCRFRNCNQSGWEKVLREFPTKQNEKTSTRNHRCSPPTTTSVEELSDNPTNKSDQHWQKFLLPRAAELEIINWILFLLMIQRFSPESDRFS